MSDWSGKVAGPVVYRDDATVVGMIVGDAMVLAGATLQLDGTVTGNLVVEIGGKAIVRGVVGGSIRNRGGEVRLFGTADDVVDAAAGAVTIVDPKAHLKARRA